MSKYKKEKIPPPPKKIYTEDEIKKEIGEMERFKEKRGDKKVWSLKSWMRWAQWKGSIKIYNIEDHSYGVILPNYNQLKDLEEQISKYMGKQEFLERKKVEGLEELAKGMKIDE